jgi:hypothetical protein
MKKQNIKLILILLCLGLSIYLLLPNSVLAFSISENVNKFGQQIYGGTPAPPQQIAAMIIKSLLTFLGIISVALILYGGFIYMTSGGEKEKVQKGKNIILYSVIGLVIILASYAIATFVFNAIINSVGGQK